MEISDAEFESIVNESFEKVSKLHQSNLENLAIVIEDEPTKQQLMKLNIRCNQTLFGLFEGIPKPQKNSTAPYSLPDKITIFKNPITRNSRNNHELKNNVANTLWHEIGHYFGLNHEQIHKLES